MIKFAAEIKRIQTMADNSIRLILDLQEYELDAARALMERKKDKPFCYVTVEESPGDIYFEYPASED